MAETYSRSGSRCGHDMHYPGDVCLRAAEDTADPVPSSRAATTSEEEQAHG